MGASLKLWKAILFSVVLVASVFVPLTATQARPASFKDVLGDSRASTASSETLTWTAGASSTVGSSETLTLTWPAGFGGISSITSSDVTWTDNGNSKTIGANCSSTNLSLTASTTYLLFTACSTYSGSAGAAIVVTLNGTNKITNHATPGAYTVNGSSTDDSSQNTMIYVTSGVTLSATITETLSFQVNAVTTGNCPTTGGTKPAASTSTTVPYGTINSDTFYDICQQLQAGTNGSGGYTATVQTVGTFASGGNTIAKGTCDGSCNDSTAAAWATAASHSGYGYCMKDTTGTAAQTADSTGWATANQCGGGSQAFKTIANAGSGNTAQAVMKQNTTTATDNLSYIGYRLTVGAGQAAGTYTATIVYICTPTF